MSDRWRAVRARLAFALAQRVPPNYPGMRLTPKRLANYYLVKYQHRRGHTRLRGYPLILTVEATNVCNLRCPYCFTGAGERGRSRSMMAMPLFRRIIDEVGDYVLHMEFYSWGDPLLNKQLPQMIRLANERGISTLVSTNFSFPFDAAKAEALVASGLSLMGVSIDGATQAAYEQYRVGGKLDLVLHNIRLMNEAKHRLGAEFPRLCWSFHAFPWNASEVDAARALAQELGIEFSATKGWVAGPEWHDDGAFQFPGFTMPQAERCHYLWEQVVINNDGAVAPCCNAFYEEDDFGSAAAGVRAVWNNTNFQTARSFFDQRRGDPDARKLICHDCPYTITWENFRRHRAAGGAASTFHAGYTTNDWFNYFFDRRPERARAADTREAAALPQGESSTRR